MRGELFEKMLAHNLSRGCNCMGEAVRYYHLEFRVESGCLGLNLGSNTWWLHGGELFVLPNFALGFPGGSDSKDSTCNAGDLGSIPGLGRSPGEGNGTLLQYSCLENSMDRGAWGAPGHSVEKCQT